MRFDLRSLNFAATTRRADYKFDVLSAFLLRTEFKFKANLSPTNRCCENAKFKLFLTIPRF
ncbi:hypothetical protein [Campylobacter sp.]|uniref:hypothetical protein n=1 Tax=Campylobacter sp. TaxID=205 RepID=UPI00361C9BED